MPSEVLVQGDMVMSQLPAAETLFAFRMILETCAIALCLICFRNTELIFVASGATSCFLGDSDIL